MGMPSYFEVKDTAGKKLCVKALYIGDKTSKGESHCRVDPLVEFYEDDVCIGAVQANDFFGSHGGLKAGSKSIGLDEVKPLIKAMILDRSFVRALLSRGPIF